MRRGRMWQSTSSSFSSLNPKGRFSIYLASISPSRIPLSRRSLSSIITAEGSLRHFQDVLTITDGTARTQTRVADSRARGVVVSPPQHCLLEPFSPLCFSPLSFCSARCVFQRVPARKISLYITFTAFRTEIHVENTTKLDRANVTIIVYRSELLFRFCTLHILINRPK